ncbi:hypothetical protein CEUSTIGMA_g1574.t1 [Chlamydomonas eustigma]|uniref:Meiosis-specific nuclear structural protein 1 n=1 Tax=Chlamydomonas eustigma TaxID=1157962 RepID=A0A250WTI3_9CHLO|nr:hypothetical protein CEUSTIGMA_g1574.t1 [Chlamydomonas eustigma]|eukprot:GAX74125.1 hypothetical protein CEUSTIGMA_g1574.t1 [Chlamydomonas eustigma]
MKQTPTLLEIERRRQQNVEVQQALEQQIEYKRAIRTQKKSFEKSYFDQQQDLVRMRDEIDAARAQQKLETNKKYQEDVLHQIEEDNLKREKAKAAHRLGPALKAGKGLPASVKLVDQVELGTLGLQVRYIPTFTSPSSHS